MKNITRYSPVSGKTITDRDYAYMREDESGLYVAMHDHIAEMEAARNRIRELENAVKQGIADSLRESFGKMITEHFREEINKTVSEHFKELCSEPKKSADPCQSLAVQFSNDLTKATQIYGRGWRTGKVSSSNYFEGISNKLECIASSDGNKCFTKGELYDFVDSLGSVLITNDDLVSNFKEDDYWKADCCGITISAKGSAKDVYQVRALSGKVIAKFVRA